MGQRFDLKLHILKQIQDYDSKKHQTDVGDIKIPRDFILDILSQYIKDGLIYGNKEFDETGEDITFIKSIKLLQSGIQYINSHQQR